VSETERLKEFMDGKVFSSAQMDVIEPLVDKLHDELASARARITALEDALAETRREWGVLYENPTAGTTAIVEFAHRQKVAIDRILLTPASASAQEGATS